MKVYTAVIERCPDTELYVGFVPGFSGAHSQAETLDELNKNLKARHLHILNFRNGASAKPLDECVYNFSPDKEKLRQAGISIPKPIEDPPVF